MYHPTRGGVRGGRDQFKWDDVKVDKHRENYLGHSVKAPVGRWQKGKDLFWYSRDKNAQGSDQDALKAEIQRVKEEEEQMMREALGLAPKRSNRPQGNRLDKHEFSELVKRGSTAEDLGKGHADAAQVNGLGFARAPKNWEETNSLQPSENVVSEEPADTVTNHPSTEMMKREDREEDENSRRKRRREERKRDKQERREKRHSRDADEKRHSRDADEKRHSRDADGKRHSRDLDEKRRYSKERRRHDSDSD